MHLELSDKEAKLVIDCLFTTEDFYYKALLKAKLDNEKNFNTKRLKDLEVLHKKVMNTFIG